MGRRRQDVQRVTADAWETAHRRGFCGGIHVDERMPSLEWAERYRVLTSGESSTAGRYSAALTPYVREWYAAMDDAKVEQVTIVAGAQIGKTQWLLNVLGSIIDQAPGNILWVWPDLEQAKKFVRHRLKLMLATPQVKRRLGKANHRQEQMVFDGGSLNFVGSNSPSSLASLPCRYLICDEVDRLNGATSEGSAIELAKARTRTFFNRKILLTSTPTNRGSSQIAEQFSQGTMERYLYRCDCGAESEITFDRLSYEWNGKRIVDGVSFACPKCGQLTAEKVVRSALESGKFRWVAEHPERRGHRSFWLNAFASPFVSWGEIVAQVERAKGNPNRLRVLKNTLLGELWEGDDIDRALGNSLMAARFGFGQMPDGTMADVPMGCDRLVCGVDTQDSYLAYEVIGVGKDGLYCISRGNISGQPSDDDVFRRLKEDVLEHQWRRADGARLSVSAAYWDSGGHYTSDVYRHVFGYRHGKCKLTAIKGVGGEGVASLRPPSTVPIGLKDTRTIQLQLIGVDAYKTRIMDMLSRGLVGFSSNALAGQDEGFFEELLSERVEYSRGKAVWVKIHRRNESLDCMVYALAALDIIGIRLDDLQSPVVPPQDVVLPQVSESKPEVTAKPLRKVLRTAGNFNPWRGGGW